MSKKIKVCESKIHGKGIFASKNIKKGETVFIIKGKKVHWVVTNQKESLFGPDWIGVDETHWMDPKESTAKYLNHSCDPNCGIKGKVNVVALRNIKKDEEITMDYSITEIDKLWYMNCRCGSKNCRKKIRSIQFLPEKFYNRYTPYIPTYFTKVYEENRNKKNN
jgi:hypothetical protein